MPPIAAHLQNPGSYLSSSILVAARAHARFNWSWDGHCCWQDRRVGVERRRNSAPEGDDDGHSVIEQERGTRLRFQDNSYTHTAPLALRVSSSHQRLARSSLSAPHLLAFRVHCATQHLSPRTPRTYNSSPFPSPLSSSFLLNFSVSRFSFGPVQPKKCRGSRRGPSFLEKESRGRDMRKEGGMGERRTEERTAHQTLLVQM
jgi:hypothetical protein